MTFPWFLPAIDGPPQRFHFLSCSVPEISSHFDATLGHVFHTFLRVAGTVFSFFRPILQCVLSIVVAAFQVATELFAAFRGQRKGCQGSRSQSDEKESDSGSSIVSIRRFITSKTHNLTSFLRGGRSAVSVQSQYPARKILVLRNR